MPWQKRAWGCIGFTAYVESRKHADARAVKNDNIMDSVQLSDPMVQNRQTGEQMTHRNMSKKENSNLVDLFNMSQCILLSSMAILYNVIAQLQRAHCQ